MSKEDKVLADYQKQLKLEQERLSDYAQGTDEKSKTPAGRKNTVAAAIAGSKQKIAKLKSMIQAHERRAKHG